MVSVAAGGAHSLAVTEDGGLWAWGAGDRGQLGLGREWWEAARQAGQEQEAEQRSREGGCAVSGLVLLLKCRFGVTEVLTVATGPARRAVH